MPTPPPTMRMTTRPQSRAWPLLVAFTLTATFVAAAGPVRAAGGGGLRQEANEYRVAGGLDAVVGTGLLDDIATRRAAQMTAANELEHDLDYVSNRLNASGVCWTGFGEIIAWERGYPDYSYERTMGLWWDSPGHHAVLMTPAYNAAGAAWDTADDGGHYSVMVFVTLCGNDFTSASPIRLLHPDEKYNPDRPLVFRAGRVTGYRFSSDGDVLARKTVTFRATTRVTAGGRVRLDGAAWLKASSGPLAGFWVRESPDVFVRGMAQRNRFDPAHRLTVEDGRYVGLEFDWLGRVTAVRKYTFLHRRFIDTTSRAVINGRIYYLFASSPLDGYWVRDTASIYAR